MEQFSLEKWLKDESRKVVTRNNIEVEIIHDSFPLVAIINGVAYNFDNDGKFQSNKTNHKYDLFFADEEEELTEFERELEMMMVSFSNGNLGSDVRKEIPKPKLHNYAHRLLDIARKELLKDLPKNQGTMTRKEEINQAAEENTSNQLELEGFIEGVEWADQHPRKGLWDADKVIDWLKKNCTYTHPRKGTEECFINLFALKDAMEN